MYRRGVGVILPRFFDFFTLIEAFSTPVSRVYFAIFTHTPVENIHIAFDINDNETPILIILCQ